MYHYINTLFPKELGYRKLVLHFGIDDIAFAEESVTVRMGKEMKIGQEALQTGDIKDVVGANMGGPYGAAVLKGVQADEQTVWKEVLSGAAKGEGPAQDWWQAAVAIKGASLDVKQAWTASAADLPGGPAPSADFKKYVFQEK
eukprot:gb/GEZN01025951.1/.p1 GENE.gb/GEZN01025951.1/~~gb/GEZN01025951.1/.p1  ORF type:complete len:165 (-),score=33.84 gb/GEZN01025951.1/:38-466(-)